LALSDKWTRAQIRTAVRRELLDSAGRWWSDDDLNAYISDWQNTLQSEFEFCWETSTNTATSFTLPSDLLRLDAAYWAGKRLVPASTTDLDNLSRYWRYANTSTPLVVYQEQFGSIGLWPPPSAAGELILEYPKKLTLTGDASVMCVPAWTKFSAVNFACAQAYLSLGPNHDLAKATRRLAMFQRQLAVYRNLYRGYFGDRSVQLVPAVTPFEKDFLTLAAVGATMPSPVTRTDLERTTITGTQDGVNTVFTLGAATAPRFVMIIKNGIVLEPSLDYTVSGLTVTFISPAQPQTNDRLQALVAL
jgi:hypothetical protein